MEAAGRAGDAPCVRFSVPSCASARADCWLQARRPAAPRTPGGRPPPAPGSYEVGIRAGHALVGAGPYALLLHPSYAGTGLLVAGASYFLAGPRLLARRPLCILAALAIGAAVAGERRRRLRGAGGGAGRARAATTAAGRGSGAACGCRRLGLPSSNAAGAAPRRRSAALHTPTHHALTHPTTSAHRHPLFPPTASGAHQQRGAGA